MHGVAEGSAKGCEGCANCGPTLITAGMNLSDCDYVVALAGNPNTGKSTVFNALTGLRQHVGNWPGKTVQRAEGAMAVGKGDARKKYKIVDLPGTYSLLSQSTDEEIARDFLLFGSPDVTVIVVDATCLERNLNLVLQVLEITSRAVVALNLMDEAERNGLKVDPRALARDLGVPVIPMAARRGRGVRELVAAIGEIAANPNGARPRPSTPLPAKLESAIEDLSHQILEAYPNLPNARWIALRLIEGDPSVMREVEAGTLGQIGHDLSVESTRPKASAEAAL